jgi:GH15 family glucan-1,4-alpha-glucosidase
MERGIFMPRDIPVGNGRLLICFDQNYCIRDLYYPHVGQENHIRGHFFRLGVWVENQFSRVGPGWKRDLRYLPDTLVTQVTPFTAVAGWSKAERSNRL